MAGRSVDLTFRNTAAVIANIYAYDAEVQAIVVQLVQQAADYCHDLAFFLCPLDTGFMREHIRVSFGPKGYSFEIGWLEEDFIAAGLAFYPIFQEYGTRFMAAQPSLGPAYDETKDWFLPQLGNALRAAAERRRSSTR